MVTNPAYKGIKKWYPPVWGSLLLTILAVLFMTPDWSFKKSKLQSMQVTETDIKLPPPRLKSGTSVEEALKKRRSARSFKKDPLTLPTVAQLLWAAQGVTNAEGKRTAPSAGALYPLELYLICGAVESLPAGVYHYRPETHTLELVEKGDKRKALYAAAGLQSAILGSVAVLAITANYQRTTVKYGERGFRYVHMEAGHAAENVYLQAVALNVGTVVIGAFSDRQVQQVLSLPGREQPLYLMPLGK